MVHSADEVLMKKILDVKNNKGEDDEKADDDEEGDKELEYGKKEQRKGGVCIPMLKWIKTYITLLSLNF